MRRPSPKTIADTGTIALVALLLAAAAFRLFLAVNLPLWLRHAVVQEDGLYLRLAQSLASGQWLGPYDQLTLMRGLGYPAFLAASSVSGLPISAAHGLFQIAAVAVASWALYRLTDSRTLAATAFLVLLYFPAGFLPDMQRVLPGQIAWAQILLVFSLAAVLFYAPPRPHVRGMALGALAGALLAWTWLTGDDGGLLLLGLPLLGAGAVAVQFRDRAALEALARNAIAATAAFLAVNALVMSANLAAYGTFSLSDAACADGRLNCRQGPAAIPPAAATQAPKPSLLSALEAKGRQIALLEPGDANAMPTTVRHVERERFEQAWAFLNNPYVTTPGSKGVKTTLHGWYRDSASTQWPGFAVQSQAGTPLPYTLQRRRSPDLQKHFSDQRPAFNRFQLSYICPDDCTLSVIAFDRPDLLLPIERDRDLSTSAGTATVYIDTAAYDWAATAERTLTQTVAARMRAALALIYQSSMPLLLLCGLIALVAAIDGAIAARALTPMLVIAGVAWLVVATQIVCLALGAGTAIPGMAVSRVALAAYLALLAVFLSFGAALAQARRLSPLSPPEASGGDYLGAQAGGKPAA